MLQYTAQDIVDKAIAIADLQNSDFITYKEKLTFLNDAYITMFNKAIDYGDNIFTNEMIVENGETELPSDFYQLREVYIMRDKTKILITPKPINQSEYELSYEIKNDTLYVYGNYQGDIYMVYYYVPSTLIVQPESYKAGFILNEGELLLACHNDLYATKDSTKVYIRSLSDSTLEKEFTVSIGVGVSINTVLMGDSYLFLIIYDPFARDYLFYAFNLYKGSVSNYSFSNASIVFDKDSPYIYSSINNTLSGFNNVFYDSSNMPIDTTNLKGINYYVNGFGDEDSVLKLSYKIDKAYIGDMEMDINVRIRDIKLVEDNFILLAQDGNLYSLSEDYEGVIICKERQKKTVYANLMGFDIESGYGLVSKDMFGRYIVEPCYDATILNYPNNTYFTLVAYYLAIEFCNKQGKDTTNLFVELEKQENSFYDSLHRDETAFRITNVDNGILY